MKKIYTLAMALGVGVTAFAAQTVSLGNPELRSKLVPMTQEEFSGMLNGVDRFSLNTTPDQQSPVLLNPNAPTFGWTTGTQTEGIYVDGIMCGKLTVGSTTPTNYNVTITRNASQTGYIRLLPFADPAGDLPTATGEVDEENYMVINMTDHDKIYMESWAPYAGFGLPFNFMTACAETGYNVNLYATYDEALQCITFPAQTIVYDRNGDAYYGNGEYAAKLFLDASLYADYSLSASAPLCVNLGEKVPLTFTPGADVNKVKVFIAYGSFYSSEASASIFDEVTETFDPTAIEFTPEATGVYSLLIAGLDKDGNAQAYTQRMVFVQDDDQANWKSIGTGKLTEGLFCSSFGGEWPTDGFNCEMEENVAQPGYFRIKNPYAQHPLVLDESDDTADMITIEHSGHSHYLYVNASNSEMVYVEPSVLGFQVNSTYGDSFASSWAHFYTLTGQTAGHEAVFGKYADKTITMPDNQMRLGFSEYSSGMPFTCGKGFKVELPADYTAAIGSIEADVDADVPVEYFNLQGMKIAKPEAGFVIVRQGSKVTKQYIAE